MASESAAMDKAAVKIAAESDETGTGTMVCGGGVGAGHDARFAGVGADSGVGELLTLLGAPIAQPASPTVIATRVARSKEEIARDL